MAQMITPLNRQTLSRMTSGEKRLARRFSSLLEDDYLVWYDIPLGKRRRYPDFILLHPSRGLLFLEVKDWKAANIQQISKSHVSLLTANGLKTKPHPLEQVRQGAYQAIDLLARDPALQQTARAYRGNLIMPYGWGVVFTRITRRQIESAIPEDIREGLLPDHLMIYQDEMTENIDPEQFQSRLWGMFNYQFGSALTLPQIDRIRAHLFPEFRIGENGQSDLFGETGDDSPPMAQSLPDIVKIMDLQQEQLARSLGDGHRVIHGVAGSGKTLILGYRCLQLADALNKPILVLCFNITLAAKLRAFISDKGIGGEVQVYHFHDWCGQQIKTYHVEMVASDKPFWERQVDSVIQGVDNGWIPRAQYGALLIDEGHDFEAEWLRLVAQMVDPETDSLLLLYDDAQSIYKKHAGLGFSLSSVGIRAQGRTTILKANYRNTREILDFAYRFARQYLDPQSADDDHIPLIEPMAAGSSGPKPVVKRFETLDQEIGYALKCLQQWHKQGIPWRDMAILYTTTRQGERIDARLKAAQVPTLWMSTKSQKASYDTARDEVPLLTIHSSKGLEFPRVIIVGVGQLDDTETQLPQTARLLYVGMTRAMECLLLTTSKENPLSRKLQAASTVA
jgi:hypothetical protein